MKNRKNMIWWDVGLVVECESFVCDEHLGQFRLDSIPGWWWQNPRLTPMLALGT